MGLLCDTSWDYTKLYPIEVQEKLDALVNLKVDLLKCFRKINNDDFHDKINDIINEEINRIIN